MDNGIGQWATKHAIIDTHRTALVDDRRSVTYAEFDARTTAVARALRENGVGEGDRVALLSLNSIEYLEVIFAVAKLGAITVPLNFRLAARELAYILRDASVTAYVFDSRLGELAVGSVVDHDVDMALPVSIGELEHGLRQRLEGATGGPVREFATLGVDSPEPWEGEVDGDTVALILYTSGTTGNPKGAMITHDNLRANAVHSAFMGSGIGRYDATITVTPLFHVGGLCVHTLSLLYYGGKVVIQEKWDARSFVEAMEKEKVTLQFLVPAMWLEVTRMSDLANFDLSAMRYAVSGGAPCPVTVMEALQGLGWLFLEGFGMTETTANTLVLDAESATSKRGSVGLPLMHVDARVGGPGDEELPVGEIGELLLRGPNIAMGYWGRDEATAESWRNGWFHSGDLCRVDEDGYFYIVDRKKDMVISGGENVYPAEVEQILHRHEGVQDVAVIGVPHEKWGETVVAVVTERPGADLDEAQVIEFCRAHLAHYKCPTKIVVVDELPRTATGKLLKRDLRQRFGGTESAVTR
ncbi:class I adenylate-forming enzyme family protein [Dietzia kunjamensis]|uniref:class I adenylate-forming enzyme family protein n=1 Tax=Dietzia kunjamensis TaxID=322509 RepID=UPI0033679FB9